MGAVEQVEVRLMGRPAVVVDGFRFEPPPGKGTAILFYLAFHGGWVGREELLYLFWADTPESRARGNLRPLLWRLGREPFGRGLESERTRVRWSVGTDVASFRESFAARRWREAWDLVGGELLAGFVLAGAPEFDRWLEAERAELRVVVRAAGARAVEELLAAHDYAAAVAITGALHRDDPLEETVFRAHLAALAGMGARREALAAFDRFRRTLVEEVGAEPEEATLALVASLRAALPMGAAAAAPAVAVASDRAERASMPVQATRLVGRVEERSAVVERLSERGSRLVTIVGPGGVGKTRLAIAVASEVASRYRHGARFVDLVAVDAVEALTAAIAQSVGVSVPGEGAAADHLLRQLRDKEMLLVLDNVEHLASDVGLIEDILATAPSVTILATSRVRLALRGERLFDLAGLPFEGGPEGTQLDAVTLFRRCARRVRPDFEPGAAELRSVGRICALVEGLPLALELAATWLRVLTLAEIEAELEAGLDLLEERDRGAARRHAGMRAVFAHSWGLLRPRERSALRALSVFHGGWTREAAAEVAGVGMPVLLALIDASLIRRDTAGRFTLHALVGRYARERSKEQPDERDDVASRHARYFLRLVAERRWAWRRHEGARLLAEVDVEWANVQAAWRWAIAHGWGEPLTAAIDGLESLTGTSRRVGMWLELVRETIAWAEPNSLLHGRALVCLGMAAIWRGAEEAVGEGTENLVEALAVLDALGAQSDVARACRFLGMGRSRQGRQAEARALWERARSIHASLGEAEGVAMMLNNLGNHSPTFDEGAALLRESIALAQGADEPLPEALASDSLGHMLFRRHGATDEAGELIARAAELLDETGFHHVAQHERTLLAHVDAARGRLLEAKATLDTVIRRGERIGEDETRRDLAAARSAMAWVAYLRDDTEAAASACRRVLTQADGPLPAAIEALARTVAGRLALHSGAHDESARELAQARAALERIASSAVRSVGGWHDAMAPVPDASEWARLLAAEVDLAVADARLEDARRAAAEGLEIALRSEQEPAATIALTAAARLLEARGDAASARALVDYVVGHAATPHDARIVAERLGAGRREGPGREAASWLPERHGASDRCVFDVANDVLDVLRARS
jgi:predicted ATPase/DNA-binding SARP family transcriptional activator